MENMAAVWNVQECDSTIKIYTERIGDKRRGYKWSLNEMCMSYYELI